MGEKFIFYVINTVVKRGERANKGRTKEIIWQIKTHKY